MKILVGYVNVGMLTGHRAMQVVDETKVKFNENIKLPPDVMQAWVPVKNCDTRVEVLEL